MNPSQIYIVISIVVLAIISLLVFFVNKNKKDKKLTRLTSLAFGFIIVGIIFGYSGLVSYSLMGTGVVLAVIDITLKLKRK